MVGLPSRNTVREIIGELIIIPGAREFGITPERLGLTYTEILNMTFEQLLWYQQYMRDRRVQMQIDNMSRE